MKNKVVINIIYVIVSLAIMIWFFFRTDKEMENEKLIFDKEYTQLFIEDDLNNSKVNNVFNFSSGTNRPYPYFAAFTLDSSSKYYVYSYECLGDSKVYINKIIREGVLLNKSKNSDTLRVANNGKVYSFIIEGATR